MKTNWMFPTRIKAQNPDVIIKREKRVGGPAYEGKTLLGQFYRVSPTTSREIFSLQMMEHQHDKFAPYDGDGIIVSAEALAKLDAQAV